MKDQSNTQAVVQDENSLGVDTEEEDVTVKPYTFPLDPERKKKIAEAFHRRIDPGESTTEVGRRGGW
jgi:hypothetical protein